MFRNLLLFFCVGWIATNVVSAQIDITLHDESTFHSFPQQIEFAKTADGTIWLLQNGGFAGDVIHSYKDGTWQEIAFEECDHCCYRIATDTNGDLFMSTSQALFSYNGSGWTKESDDVFSSQDIAFDSNNNLWFYNNSGTETLSSRAPDGTITTVAGITGEVKELTVAPDNTVWFRNEDKVVSINSGTITRYDLLVFYLQVDKNNTAWFVSIQGGIGKIENGIITTNLLSEAFNSFMMNSFAIDRENELFWFGQQGTEPGIMLWDGKTATLTPSDLIYPGEVGLTDQIFVAGNGSIWAGSRYLSQIAELTYTAPPPPKDPGSGEIIITEYFNRPQKPTDTQLAAALANNPAGADTTPNEGHTEWFEVYNTTDDPVVMDGWTLTDASSTSSVTTITSFTLAPKSYAVFSGFNIPEAQGGIEFDYFYDYKKPSFNNETSYSDPGDTSCPDGVIISKGDGSLVDEVVYDYGYGEYIGNDMSGSCKDNSEAIGLPGQGGSSKVSFMLNVDPAVMNSAANDLPENWRYSTNTYDFEGNQIGTPGLQNDAIISSINHNFLDSNTRIYPNPANSILNVVSDLKGTLDIQVFDVVGKNIALTRVNNRSIDVSRIPTGFYLMKIGFEGKSTIKKIAIQR